MRGNILVLSGPSGCGKSSVISEALKRFDDIYFSISTTTRPKRSHETDGVDYYFISKEQFEKEIADGCFLEWAKVHDNYYGTSLRPIEEALDAGKLVLFDIDVQGHAMVRAKYPRITTSLFMTTPSEEVLRERLIHRGTDPAEVIERRLKNSREEMKRMEEYDFLLINDRFEETLDRFFSIIKTARLKHTLEDLQNFYLNW